MDLNPYAPAGAGHDAVATGVNDQRAADRPIRFGGVVREADVAILGRSAVGVFVAAVLLILGVAAWLLLLFAPVIDRMVARGQLGLDAMDLIVLGFLGLILVLLPLFLLGRFRGLYFARGLQNWSPRIVGPVEGTLHEQTVELAYPELRSVIPLQSLTGVRLSPRFVAFTHDYHQMQLCVLPSAFFEQGDLPLVHERLAPLAAERPWLPGRVSGLDPRPQHGEPLELIPRVEGAISFAGTLVFSDFAATATYRKQMRRVYRFFVVLGVLAVAAAVCSGVLTQSSLVFAAAALLLAVILSTRLVRWKQQFKRHFPSGDQVIARLSGFLSDDGLTVNSAIGSTTYRHAAFQRVEFANGSIELVLRSRVPQVILLKESMFGSPDDFQRVCRWAQATV
jgi:hypothetical protein